MSATIEIELFGGPMDGERLTKDLMTLQDELVVVVASQTARSLADLMTGDITFTTARYRRCVAEFAGDELVRQRYVWHQ